MLGARLRLAALWLSQVARIMADNCLRIFVVFELGAKSQADRESAWYLVASLFVIPSVFLAPVNGAISNSLPKRKVLIGAAAFCSAVISITSILNGPWLWALALVAMGQALYSPTRYALLPAAAQDTDLPLTRVNGWIEMGSVSAIVAGMLLGGYLHTSSGAELGILVLSGASVPMTITVVSRLNLVGLIAAWPVRFPSDVYRPEPPVEAVRGFFRDSRRILQVTETRNYLLALAGLRGLVLVMPGALIASASNFEDLVPVALWSMVGAALGSVLAGVQRHPLRALGLVPFAMTGLALALVWAARLGDAPPAWLCLWMGAMGGIINVPLFANYQLALPADARGNGIAVLNTAGYLCMATLALLVLGLSRGGILGSTGQIWFVTLLGGVAAAVAWWALLREAYDQCVELVFWPMFRVRCVGPGIGAIPRTGPLLVVSNHSCWFDPLFLGKVLPRRLTAMLTSQFYDMPVLHFLARHVVHAIRVPHGKFRRDAPELQEALAALGRGEAVLIFPEGQMRKRPDRPLLHFGRGIAEMLQERPTTPVVICWIEGAWGSYTSYLGGPPTRNKRPDFWRPIAVAVSAPQVLDAVIVADHRATRSHLMKECLEARRHLGLEPLTLPAPGAKEPALAHDDRPDE